MVFSGLFPIDGDDFEDLRDSLEKLKLNDASITYTPETSGALGFGFRCGFLGLLHMEIVKERLEREFGLALIATAPSVEYRIHRTDGTLDVVDNPADMPDPQSIDFIEEPYFKVGIITPTDVHRDADGAVPAAPRRARQDRVPVARAGRAALRDPAGRGRRRLVRPAEEPQPGLRQPRLRAGRLPPLEPGEGRPAAQRRRRPTPSRRSCTATGPTTTASRWPRSCSG